MHLGQHRIIHSQLRLVVPYLKYQNRSHIKFLSVFWIRKDSVPTGFVDPDIDSKIKRAGDPCIFIFYPTISHFSLLQSSVVDPDVSGPPPVLGSVIILNGSESFHHKAKRVRKTFGFYCFVTSL